MGGAELSNEGFDQPRAEAIMPIAPGRLDAATIVRDDELEPGSGFADYADVTGTFSIEGVLDRVGDELIDDDRDGGRLFGAGNHIVDVAVDLDLFARQAALDLLDEAA